MTFVYRLTPSPVRLVRRPKKSPSADGAAGPTPAAHRLRAFYLHMALWTVQAWLAMFFVGAAYAKLTQPQELLGLLLGWSQGVDHDIVRAVGMIELALALGVLAPLVAWRGGGQVMAFSAIGMIGLTAFALALHLSRLELGFATLNLCLASLALAVLVGWLRKAPVTL
ncbi:DoxX family protein [uncultured Brevundimonas sp.]|uniref:DoxX family protein n=1 Tax=uncultured Brevundimonas sp. TaxID=213418 RepID=UPI002624CAE3|nr:DoxX family protein [uncultured Brevundimonas sp.]